VVYLGGGELLLHLLSYMWVQHIQWLIVKKVVTIIQELYKSYKRIISLVYNFCTTSVQFQQLFFKLTIEFIFLHISPTYLIVDFKNKLLRLYKNYKRVINVLYLVY
jgi:hypothetical protein